jgi:hypothetical protein
MDAKLKCSLFQSLSVFERLLKVCTVYVFLDYLLPRRDDILYQKNAICLSIYGFSILMTSIIF